MPSFDGDPVYYTLDQYRAAMPEHPEYLLQLYVLQGCLQSNRQCRRNVLSLILASSESFMGQPFARLMEASDFALAVFDINGIVDFSLINLEEADDYEEDHGPLPPAFQNKLLEWAINPQLLVDHIQQLYDQLPGSK